MTEPVPPGEGSPDAIDVLLRPRSVAIVGVSERTSSMSGLVLTLLDRFKFPGPVYPVNPKYDALQGHRCFARIGDIPPELPVDVAVVSVPAEATVAVATECGERGVRGLVLLSAGFAEIGERGAELEAELAAVARRYRMSVAGPNCAGIANFHADFVAYGTTNFVDLDEIVRGGVALVSASGGFGNTIFTYCQERRLGVSHLIGLGNETVTTVADHLDALVRDPSVSTIAGYIEAVRDPEAFFAAADRAIDAGKPIVLLKAGRSAAGQHSIRTHTAALGGSPAAFAGAFLQHGVVQVHDLDELVDTTLVLERCPPTTGNRLGVFSLAGGGTSLVADVAADHGFEVPELRPSTVDALTALLPAIAVVKNPLDPTAGFGRDSAKLRKALSTFAADDDIDVVVFFPLAAQVDYSQQLADDLIAVTEEIGKPIVCIWTAGRHLESGAWRRLHESGVPLFTSTTACFRALGHLRHYSRLRARRGTDAVRDFGPYHRRPAPATATAGELLDAFGVRRAASTIVTTAEDARAAAASLGGQVAMKVASADIPHKTEAGGVVLAVSEDDAANTFHEIIARVSAAVPDAVLDGVEVQEMAPPGVEMLVGVTTDEQLGPLLVVGMGGVLAEVLDDVAMRPVPISRADAASMLEQLRGAPVLAGVRGRPPADVDALVDLMLSVSALADAVRDRAPEIDLNPVVVLPAGCGAIAVDHLVELR